MARGRKKKPSISKGLGPRYGGSVRKRYAKVVGEMRKPHKCPRCGSDSVRRRSVGIWNCSKCDATFTGGAYTPTTKLGIVARRAVRGTSSAEAATGA
jgi:large subunit ribosomal protein L37Ae